MTTDKPATTLRSWQAQPAGRAPRLIAYLRVSTADQAENGQSLAVQQKQIEGWAQMTGQQVTEVVVEAGVSGGKEFAKRPQGAQLWRRLARGDTLVVWKLDRLSRDLLDCLTICREFQKRGVKLYLLDISPSDPMTGNGISQVVLSLLGAFAQFERGRISERIREAKAERRARGEFLGGTPPFGWTYQEGRLLPVPQEQQALRHMRELAADGKSSRAISAELKRQGFRLSHVTVNKILRHTPSGRPGVSPAGDGPGVASR